ncbi:MAG TPA: hypothetical protein VFE51_06565 [Verrucomicrobiae bacterium]|nr:hypothetical protein [Verrucomicrobiae bacterium]
MKPIRLLAVGTMLTVALTTPAQQNAAGPGGTHGQPDVTSGARDEVPTVETHLTVLTEKLELTGDQQVKIRPILQELHDATQKIAQDDKLSREERLNKVRPERFKADKKIREILSDDQKKKLDQFLHGPHGEMHGSLSGATPPPPRAPKN